MKPPTTLKELLEERILFCERYLNSKYPQQQSDFTKALVDFKYCQRLYNDFLQSPSDLLTKTRYKNIAIKIIMDLNFGMDKQEYECISLHGVLFPTKTKSYLPQETKDNIQQYRAFLETIFNEVMAL